MARKNRAEQQQRRARAKLREAGIGALVLGVAFLIAPLLLTRPIVHAVAVNLRTPGWLAVIAGVVLLALHRFTYRPIAERIEPTIGSAPPASGREEESDPPPVPTAWSAKVFDIIEWRRFEALCEWLFRQAGFETKTQSHGADGGIDIWLYSRNYPDGPISVVQCKCWSKTPVKVSEVRQLLGAMADKKVKRGIFATTSTFTHDARQLAKDNAIQLLDRTALLALIAKRTAEQQAELLAVATKDEFWKPTCPSCGVKMTRRSGKDGGKRFWGCVNFPRCRTVLNG